ncbi:MAG: leucyl/phenylalanyl-tRNA--protein transferase [Alphaproteobacteria bacterium]|nr:leucyl/phenylalanyl-tRNA--protein transferase [Alphaproteobacteria bacterium]MBL6940252.1 leucyl/phenylalanyl-tRNA--protein transferase [Alphaproteobacteria bacterium]MBL7096840.1 leucyl/phenylalanyl-tRNA--protein transferase [Alphaproteobacteria bacterium]
MHGNPRITPELLLAAYAEGIFPMAERRDDPTLFWVSPEIRGIIPLNGFHVPRRLARTVRSDRFQVTTDAAFLDVMQACAEAAPSRTESWINAEIIRLYSALHAIGHAHSIECWLEGALVGGLYGVSLGGVFFGESMFSRVRDASKVALVHLIAQLKRGGYVLLDAQFQTEHLRQFGTQEIPRAEYLARLHAALAVQAYWSAPSGSASGFSRSVASGETGRVTLVGPMVTVSPGATALQLITQIS